MSESAHPPQPDDFDAFKTRAEVRHGWRQRRREKISAEVEANRRGDYTVPTWVLVAALLAIVAAWAAIVTFA